MVKGFNVISETEVDFFLGGGHLCFLHDSMNAGNLISTLTVIKEKLLFRCEGFREVISVMPDVRIPEREERRFPRQCNSQKKGKFTADSSQGSCHTSNAVVGGQRALSPSCYPIYKVCISSW